jgi:hypothetical protein
VRRHDLPRPASGQGAELEHAADAAEEPGQEGLGLPNDRILGEISHEMGNYFHKLYYWTEYLRERSRGDETAVEMLEDTVARLEHFMRMTLEYFAPARLTFTRLRAEDLVLGLGSRLPGRRLVVEGASDVRTTVVLADASLIGHAMRAIFERTAATLLDEDRMTIRLVASERRDFRGVDVEFAAGKGASETQALARGIEMAVAEKFIQMHGGEIFERKGGGSEPRALIVFLPIYS